MNNDGVPHFVGFLEETTQALCITASRRNWPCAILKRGDLYSQKPLMLPGSDLSSHLADVTLGLVLWAHAESTQHRRLLQRRCHRRAGGTTALSHVTLLQPPQTGGEALAQLHSCLLPARAPWVQVATEHGQGRVRGLSEHQLSHLDHAQGHRRDLWRAALSS